MVKSHHRPLLSMKTVHQLQLAAKCNIKTYVIAEEVWIALFVVKVCVRRKKSPSITIQL